MQLEPTSDRCPACGSTCASLAPAPLDAAAITRHPVPRCRKARSMWCGTWRPAIPTTSSRSCSCSGIHASRAAAAGLDLVAVTEDTAPICRLLPPVDGDVVGKKFHDPLAACCSIDESIGTWAEVELFRERGLWGSRLASGSGVYIITDYDRARFVATLTAA